jgi:Fuc2NAc and GlcNAc transferase
VLLLGVFIVDSTVTLLRRALSREKWYEGHASHAYQNAARQYQSHAKVTITVLVINCLWLAPLAWLSVRLPQSGFYLSLVGLTPLALLALKLGAGEPDERPIEQETGGMK